MRRTREVVQIVWRHAIGVSVEGSTIRVLLGSLEYQCKRLGQTKEDWRVQYGAAGSHSGTAAASH